MPRKHHALFYHIFPMHHCIRCFINRVRLQLAQVAERAHIYANQRHPAFHGVPCCPYQRAVTAKHKDAFGIFLDIPGIHLLNAFLLVDADNILAASAPCFDITAKPARLLQVPVL